MESRWGTDSLRRTEHGIGAFGAGDDYWLAGKAVLCEGGPGGRGRGGGDGQKSEQETERPASG